MRSSFRCKMAVSFLAVAVTPLIALGVYVGSLTAQRCQSELANGLQRSALLAADEAALLFEHPDVAEACQALAERLGSALGARVTLIARDGRVLGDNQHPPASMENHADRPEVREALAQGVGRAVRHSETLGLDMLYVAARVGPPEAPAGTARVALPLTEVRKARRQATAAVVLAGAVGVIGAVLLSLWLSRIITEPLSELSQAAKAIADGDLDRRVRLGRDDELGQVAATFNAMADQLRQTIDTLNDEKAQAEALLTQMADGVIVVGKDGRVATCNVAAAEMFGVPAEQMIGRTLAEATVQYELNNLLDHACRHGTSTRAEIRLSQPRQAVLDTVITPIQGPSGSLQAAVCVLHDITELRKLETVRRDFVANVSHELRTPVAGIRSTVEALLSGARDEPEMAERFLRNLAAEAERLGNLVDDLLELARIESGKMDLRLRPVAVAEVAESVLTKVQAQAAAKGLSVHNHISPQHQVLADRDALQQIVLNLMDNAIKYTQAGGEVRVQSFAEDAMVRLEVTDNGPGIPEADLPRIFERFYQVDPAHSRAVGGTGLGLSIVKHLTEVQGGQVMAESALGRGSRFIVWLPAA